jgi:hypothetical protein
MVRGDAGISDALYHRPTNGGRKPAVRDSVCMRMLAVRLTPQRLE